MSQAPTAIKRLQENGALREDALYVERGADQELYEAIRSGEFCAVLAPRQIGKSSLRVHTARRLSSEGVHCAQIDLTALGKAADRDPVGAWYFSLISRIARELALPDPRPFFERTSARLPADRFGLYLREQVLPAVPGPVVLFIDEIDYLRTHSFDKDELFVAIRALYNERAQRRELSRLTFCLLGVAAPRDLVKNPDITPFNIGRSIRLADFSRQEIAPFAAPLATLGGDPRVWLDEIYRWTAGHPYMTQVLCHYLLLQRSLPTQIAGQVEHAVTARFLRNGRSTDDNLSYAEKRLDQSEKKPELLALYRRILIEGAVPLDREDPAQQELQLCGLAATDYSPDGRYHLRVRNRIFTRVFDREWVQEKESQRKLIQSMRRWQAGQRHDDMLLRGTDLAEAGRWVSEHVREVTADEHEFLRASLDGARRDAERARLASEARSQRLTLLALGLFVGVLMVLLVGLYEQYQRAKRYAQSEARAAVEAKRLERAARAESARAESAAAEAKRQRQRAEDLAASESVSRRAAQRAAAAEAAAKRRAVREAQSARAAAAEAAVAKHSAEQERARAEYSAALASAAATAERAARKEAVLQRTRAEQSAARERQARFDAESVAAVERSLRAAIMAAQPGRRVQALVEGMHAVQTMRHSALGPVWEGLNRAAEQTVLSRVSRGHAAAVWSVDYSPDGRRLVSASEDRTARVWDVATGHELLRLRGHTDLVHAAGYSPDGRYIVTASADQTAIVWDALTGAAIRRLMHPHLRIFYAAFSHDGTRIVTTSNDHKARLWDVRQGRVKQVLSGHSFWVWSAAFSPDDRNLVTASADQTARVWDVGSGKLLRVLRGHSDSLRAVAYSPDGAWIATASADQTARVWDARAGRLLSIIGGHSDLVRDVAFSPDSRYLVTTSEDSTARVWNPMAAKLIASLEAHSDAVNAARFSPDGSQVATASKDRTVRLWQWRKGGLLRSLEGHKGFLHAAAYSPSGHQIATAGADGNVRLWDSRSGEPAARVLAHPNEVLAVRYSPDGTQLATGCHDNQARIWSVTSGALLRTRTGHAGSVRAVAFAPDGWGLATASDDTSTRVWSVAGSSYYDEPLWLGSTLHLNSRPAPSTTPQTPALLTLGRHTDSVLSVTYSPSGGQILTAGADKSARVWDAGSGQALLVLLGHRDWVRSAAYSPDGRYVVTASDDHTARIWDARNGQYLSSLVGHGDRVRTAAYSPDGRYIVTASEDRTARIWDATSSRLLISLEGHRGSVLSAVFSPDGSSVVTAGADGVAQIHPVRPEAIYDFACKVLATIDSPRGVTEQELQSLVTACNTDRKLAP